MIGEWCYGGNGSGVGVVVVVVVVGGSGRRWFPKKSKDCIKLIGLHFEHTCAELEIGIVIEQCKYYCLCGYS